MIPTSLAASPFEKDEEDEEDEDGESLECDHLPPGVMVYRLPQSPVDSSTDSLELKQLALFEFADDFSDICWYGCQLYAVNASWPNSSICCDSDAVSLLAFDISDPRHDDRNVIVPVSTFLTEDVRTADPESDTVITVPWKQWHLFARFITNKPGHQKTDRPRTYGSYGSHIVFEDRILDFNQYDVANDIYAQPPSRPHKLKNTPTHGRNSDFDSRPIRHTSSTTFEFAGTNLWITQLPYRSLQVTFPKVRQGASRDGTLSIIEEEDGPKVITVACDHA